MPVSTIIVAHRGLHKSAPENSVASFKAAVAAKIRWVECDVWPSADGVPVVIHDQTLDRTTIGTGAVSQRSWHELQRLRVPSLAEVLSVLGETGILVEIKPPNAVEFVDIVRRDLRNHRGPSMIQSFHHENLRKSVSEIPTAFLFDDTQAIDTVWPNVHVDHRLIDQTMVERLHSVGRKIGAWTVNAPLEIVRMFELEVDMLITDEPDLAAEIQFKR